MTATKQPATVAQHKGFEFTESDIVNPDNWIPAGEYNPHNVRPWLFYGPYGVLGVAFADCESDALDELVDEGKAASILIDEKNFDDYGVNTDSPDCAFAGNASEPVDLTDVGILEVPNPAFSWVAQFNEAFS